MRLECDINTGAFMDLMYEGERDSLHITKRTDRVQLVFFPNLIGEAGSM